MRTSTRAGNPYPSGMNEVLSAILLVAVVGTLANDGGIGVWQPATAVAATAVGCLWAARLRRARTRTDSSAPLQSRPPRA